MHQDINASKNRLRRASRQNEGHRLMSGLPGRSNARGTRTRKRGGRLRHGLSRDHASEPGEKIRSSGSQVFFQAVTTKMAAKFAVVRAGRFYEVGIDSYTPLMVAWHRSEPICRAGRPLLVRVGINTVFVFIPTGRGVSTVVCCS